MAKITKGLEEAFACKCPRIALEAMKMIEEVAAKHGLEPGHLTWAASGEAVLTNTGGVTTTISQSGSIVMTRGGEVIFSIVCK